MFSYSEKNLQAANHLPCYLAVAGADLAVQQSMEVSYVGNSVDLCAHLMQFTSTQSVFVMRCGPVDVTATFLSPVEVSNCLVLQ